MELEESTFLTLDYTTKLMILKLNTCGGARRGGWAEAEVPVAIFRPGTSLLVQLLFPPPLEAHLPFDTDQKASSNWTGEEWH